MQICYLTRIFPPRIGGPGTLTYLMGKDLIKKGYSVTVVTQGKGDTPNYEVKDGIKVHRTFCFENEFTFYNLSISTMLFFRKVLSQIKCNDIFQAMDISIGGFTGWLAKYFTNKSFFLHYGGDLVFEFISLKNRGNWDPRKGVEKALEQKNFTVKILRAIQDDYMKKYDMIIPDSKYGERLLLEKMDVPEDKVKLIVNGVDTDKFKPGDKQKIKKKLGLNGKVILTATRLVPWKGIDVLIKSMPKVLQKVPDVNLIIAGEGTMYDKLRILIESMNLGHKVKLVGRLSEETKLLYMKACDVYALPSFFDTTPNTLLEIMASGKPTVLSDIDGLREVVTDKTSIKIPVGNINILAKNLIEVLTDEERMEKMGLAARKHIMQNYSMRKMMNEYIKLYESWAR